MAFHCSVIDCANGSYRLERWKAAVCEIHGARHDSDLCCCEQPFRLYPLPTRKRKPEERRRWLQLINRLDTKAPGKLKLWSPPKTARVCSKHFRDGKPSEENPYPTEDLGYEGFREKVARILSSSPSPGPSSRKRPRWKLAQHPATDVEQGGAEEDMDTEMDTADFPDMSAGDVNLDSNLLLWVLGTWIVLVVFIKKAREALLWYAQSLVEIVRLTKEINTLKKQVQNLHAENIRYKNQVEGLKKKRKLERKLMQKPRVFEQLITEANINYYTGISKVGLFCKLHDFVVPFVQRRWQGALQQSKPKRQFQRSPTKFGPQRFLDSIDEMLLVFMRLRLCLDLRDLADRFWISASLAGRIFTSWISALSATLGKSLVYLPDKETIDATKPIRYKDTKNLACIIDCTEVFIERPHDLQLQNATWSNYKHHNTLKILVGVLPNSMISFISRAYEGRISDKELTIQSGFWDTLPPYVTVMADRGFSIPDKWSHLLVNLEVPPGRRGKAQMSAAAVKKTKLIANRRILVEQVIRRLKTFRILKNELPISALHHIDDVILVCAALTNLKEPIYKV